VSSRLAAGLLLGLGLAQMAADVAGLDLVQGLAAATGASPAPKVFGSVQGHETFSARFTLQWETVSGTSRSLDVTPDVYASLRGPYNRRNAYGAALSYGPVLQHDPRASGMFRSVATYGLCGGAPALRELTGETDAVRRARAVYRPASRGASPLVLEVRCP
jgi:hypothetical protein